MSPERILMLSRALAKYYSDDHLRAISDLFDVRFEYDHLAFAKKLLNETDSGNNYRLLVVLLDDMMKLTAQLLERADWAQRQEHLHFNEELSALKAALGDPAPEELTVAEGKPFSAKSEVREMLAKATTEVLIVDQYLGTGTLDCAREVSTPLRILTSDKADRIEAGFEKALKEFRSEGHAVEVRTHPKLHDRHLVFNDRCWLVGSSLKDAGKKRLNVMEVVDAKAAIVAEVQAKWNSGTPIFNA